jgi:anaerobic magnesium-protoporphyrin IX monomethyl ester cyclase
MNVLFIYSLDNIHPSGKPLKSWSGVQFGISSISSVLKGDGHRTSLLILGSSYFRDSMKLLTRQVEEFNPDLICFSAVYSQYAFLERTARFVRERWPKRYLMIGGVHATLKPEEVVNGPFDALCIGEGEFPVLELCRQLEARQEPHGIANLWITSRGAVEKNPTREFIANLDELPFPDLEIWKPWIGPKDDEMTILAGRGCPYDCTYCSNHALRQVAGGKYVRTRSPENLLKEVVHLYENFPQRTFSFEIETLDCNTRWALELCDKLEAFNEGRTDPVNFGANYRISPRTINEELFRALKRANFSFISIGLESGCERVRQDVLKRSYSNDDFLRVIALARKHGLQVYLYNMIGLPGETLADHQETIRLNRLCQPEGHHTGIFFPYPGTELYQSCLEQGLIGEAARVALERRQPVMALPDFSRAQIKKAYTWFNFRVYRGHRPTLGLLAQVFLVRISASPAIKFILHKIVRPLLLVKAATKGVSGHDSL